MNQKPIKTLLFALGLGLSGSATAQIVYQDNFDEDGLDTNTGTGGGGLAETFNNTTGSFAWNDNDDLDEGLSTGAAGSGGQITTFASSNSFNVSNGFTLEVVFDMESNVDGARPPYPSNHFSFGLIADAQLAQNGFFSGGDVPTTDAIGFSLGIRGGSIDEGLLDWDADGDDSVAPAVGLQSTRNAITFATGSSQTMTLDVESDGTYTYTYDDLSGTPQTGAGTTSIDLTQTYFFKARTQGSINNVIQSITLTTNSTQFAAPTVTTAATVYDLGQPIDVVIAFDPTATSATLVNLADVTTSVDLIALDAADAVPNDGQVVFTDMPSPLGLNTYEVTASRPGIAPLTESTEVTQIDPADEAPDNAFSLAIKAENPLFYYRFEDASDSTFVRDSSGNRLHTNDFTANLLNAAFGNGPAPGGLGNAADFRPTSGGARGIRVPVTSEMSESFTFTTLVNISPTTVANPRTLLSMASGTGTGAIILNRQNADTIFRSNLDGTLDVLSSANGVPFESTCLLHYVFTADDLNGGGTHTLYVNGEEAGTSDILTSFGPNEGNWIIGADPILGDPSWFDWIDESAIFEKALTPAQISTQVDAFFAAADPFLGFYADVDEVAIGEQVTLTWKVSDSATAVTINGVSVDGAVAGGVYSDTFEPTETTTYTIEVTGPDGPFTEDVLVTVSNPQPIVITGCSLDDASPPLITIDFTGTPSTAYQVYFSSDLDFDGPNSGFAIDVSTDAGGVGTTTFPTVGASEFYRIQELPTN